MFKKPAYYLLALLWCCSVALYAGISDTLGGEDPVAPLQTIPLKVLRSQCETCDFPFGASIIYNNDVYSSYPHVFEMLVGRVAGVWVSGSMNRYVIRIRGASGPPLLVIDGMPFPFSSDIMLNDLAQMIAPQDVDRIEVIKNPAGAILYGPGAGNGVIVIHTKRGQIAE